MSLRCTLLLLVLALNGCAQLGMGDDKCSLDGRCARATSPYAVRPAPAPLVASSDTPAR